MGFFARRIQQTCLRPSFSLRVQMILSFGITAAIAIMSFVLVGLYTTVNSGASVREEATKVLVEGIQYSLGRSAQYVAETMAKKFHNIGGAGSLIAQATQDRIVGYPTMPGWEEDLYVPFQDVYTKLRFYPVIGEPLALDWNLPGNINPQNVEEHMPGRPLKWYPPFVNVSSVAGYFMQGACNPTATSPRHPAFFPGCTNANNDLITGGVIQPTETNYHLADKSKDIVWMLKALYESHLDVKTIGIFFANDGAGSTVQYPGSAYGWLSNYTSIGCDWMKRVHPRTNRSIGTPEQIARCHEANTTHSLREYNPLERGWCRDQVFRDIAVFEGRESPEQSKIQSTGPYKSPSAFGDSNLWVMTFGEAVFDFRTGEFIGCTLVDASVDLLYDMLNQTTNIGNTTKSALIRFDEKGTIIVANNWYPKEESNTGYITDEKLQMGVDAATYNTMRNLINYDEVWDPNYVMSMYRNTILQAGQKLIMMHPVPSVPQEYDPSYYPVYLVVISMDEEEAYGVLWAMDAMIEADTAESGENILLVGGIGFGVILFFVGIISGSLTKPLRWMQKVSVMIVDSCGESEMGKSFADKLNPKEAHPLWSPNTEVTLLLAHFMKMIHEFSGVGASEVAGGQVNEVKNRFEWRKMYEATGLYPWGGEDETKNPDGIPSVLKIHGNDTFDDELTTESTLRTADRSIFSMLSTSVANSQYAPVVEAAVIKTTSIMQSVKEYAVIAGAKAGVWNHPEEEKIDGPPKVNLGENIVQPKALTDYYDGVEDAENSGLFWWMTFFIGTPIVIAAIMISVTVARDSSVSIPKWLAVVQRRSIEIELRALITATKNRAAFGEQVMHRFARDLHVYTRAGGWLLFDGLRRADFMAFQVSGAEQCKFYNASDNTTETCPFLENETLTPCPCAWDDPWGINCTVDNFTHPRYFMHRWYEGLSSDADDIGDRFNITWPKVDYLPRTTNWWSDINAMPGAYKGERANGYETTYDRVRVGSALSVADFPIYNYYPGKGETGMLGTYIGYEADGMFTGFSGCESYAGLPFWQSSEGNGGFKVNKTLCPEGKYGFDARCRGWYGSSKAVGGDFYITPPYLFASSNVIGMSAGAALIDPRTGTHVGVTLIDFSPAAFVESISGDRTAIGTGSSGFPIVITPEPDQLGYDTLVGPGFIQGVNTSNITALVLPHDTVNTTNWIAFENDVLVPMRSGESTYVPFTRTTSDGQEQNLYMAFAPVWLRSLVAVNHSDFLAGTHSSVGEVYALGFGITLEDLEFRFLEVENKVRREVSRVTYISLALIIFSVLMVMYMTYTMAIYLAEPVLLLVGIVKNITSNTIEDELPKLNGGSCEITNVYDSLEKLCKIVRFSNAAYFKGDRTKSYKVLEEALELFNVMGNQKAVGVANNNLGTMVLQEQMERSSTTARSEEVYKAGIRYFEEAIRIGTFEYQNADFDDYRGDFVKQLANRYFNRGMFYIVNRDKKSAVNLEETGISDLKRAKTLDAEAFLYWTERGQLVQQARKEFFCYLRRARGIMTLMQGTDFQDPWGVESLISRADDMLHNPDYINSNLFENVSLVARKQQVNDLRIQWALIQKDTLAAATMAMKILVEDEYVIDTVLMNCVTTLNTHLDLHGQPNQVPNLAQGVKRETRRGQVDSLREAKNVVFCLDYSGSMNGERMQRANANLIWIYQEHCLDKDYVGFCRFNHAVDDKLYFDLARKGNNQDEHIEILGKALDAEGGTRLYAALNKCVNMAIESGNDYDCWIIALTDGESAWDFPAKQVIARINKHNKKGGPQINVIIIGFEVPPSVAESVATITSITEKSMYIDAQGGLDEMDNAFEQVAAVITGTATTMETF